MSYETDPNDIPKSGTRHDMTLLAVGPAGSDTGQIGLRAIIDNGDYVKKRVSHIYETREAFNEQFLTALAREQQTCDDIVSVNEQFKKRLRFSGEVHAVQYEDQSGVRVTYRIKSIDYPQQDPELRLRKDPTQFKR